MSVSLVHIHPHFLLPAATGRTKIHKKCPENFHVETCNIYSTFRNLKYGLYIKNNLYASMKRDVAI